MIVTAFVFLFVALIAALLGFCGLANRTAGFARILFFACIILFLVSTLYGLSHTA
jgi:uncharacterized membrane protein YtjA (UPF0391 family)